MKCPYCQNLIDNDSRYCDQCGTQLMYCPSCGQAKKGSSCPRCGELLISGNEYFSNNAGAQLPGIQQPGAQPTPAPQPAPQPVPQPAPQPAPQPVQQPAPQPVQQPIASQTLRLEGEGLSLELKEGDFGRKCGPYPEFSRFPTVSGKHARITKVALIGWFITDLGSTNGTFINNQRLTPNLLYELKPGMTLKIATLIFTVR